jgi:DNA-binding transcriptional regulator of glucitol operon
MAARSYRFAWHPVWLAGHVLVLAASVTMVLLGHWQLTVSEHKGFSLQNFGYALQWWAFSVAAIFLWVRIIRDRADPVRAETIRSQRTPVTPQPSDPVAYRRYVMPTVEDTSDDPEIARYNQYLRSLDGQA